MSQTHDGNMSSETCLAVDERFSILDHTYHRSQMQHLLNVAQHAVPYRRQEHVMNMKIPF